MDTGYSGKRAVLGTAAALFLLVPTSIAQSDAAEPVAPAPADQPYRWPATLTNARILPADAGSERLRGTMVAFSVALGVRCSFCHVGGEEVPLSQRDFASDANPKKDIARAMMRMTWTLNKDSLPAIAGIAKPQVSCYSCHRGGTTPLLSPPAARPTG